MTKRTTLTLLKKMFLKLSMFANQNGLPRKGQFASLDFFVKKWRRDIQKLKFNRNTKISKLSTEEWAAIKTQGAEESYLTVMPAEFIAQIDLMNVTEQNITLSSYTSGEILSARQKPDNGRPKGDIIGKRSFPKRGTKC